MSEVATAEPRTASNNTASHNTTNYKTVYAVLFAISFCHLLNDMMQSLLPAIYPTLKSELNLSFGQIGFVTLAFQVTASLLQPLVGLYTDRKPMPYSLPVAMLFTLAGLVLLASSHTYPVLLAAAALVGIGSSVFHPESSRVARTASGGRPGLAQSVFQVGGSIGSALGPLVAALVVLTWGQSSIAWFSLAALLAAIVLWQVGRWFKVHGAGRIRASARAAVGPLPSPRRVQISLAILLTLIFSKFVYLASLTSYYTFYQIERFHSSVRAAQINLFLFLAAGAIGMMVGGPLGDRFGRKYVIWFSILATLPFTLALPYANETWTMPLTLVIGLVLSSAFPAIVVYGQELVPGKVGMISGLFFGAAFGMAGLGAAVLGVLADRLGIEAVYQICSYLPLLGLLTIFLPNVGRRRVGPEGAAAAAH